MLEIIFYVLLGAFIGWNLPQPGWAKSFQEKHLQKYLDMIPFFRK
jgi:hypothetical protein